MATQRITKKDALALSIVHSAGNVTADHLVALHPNLKPHVAADMVKRADKTVRVMVERRDMIGTLIAPPASE
jgi:hypothetical protein